MTVSAEQIPFHLQQFVAQQDYSQYTAIDHASWRYIMLISRSYFNQHAHPRYLDGLAETGISFDRIPRITEMDEKLRRFGWRAVTITGFIPPEAFLEFLSLHILPIACDMRKLEHLEYTPAPDIVHEAAGHAPIIVDKAYASYLAKFGEVARRVIFAKEDNDVYKAVLELSEVKEDPSSSVEDIAAAQTKLDIAYTKVPYVSEAQQLARLGWWTIEYGLYKESDRFLIYGAGLLSSVGESYTCLDNSVPKIPLTIQCVEQDYDITKPQPQLFYTENFEQLEGVIDELASRMAYRRGGIEGLTKAKQARTVTTTELESGVQVSGVLTDFKTDAGGEVSFVKFSGPVQIACGDQQIENQGPTYHKDGFSSPIGRIKDLGKSTSEMTAQDFVRLGFANGESGKLEFTSGIVLEGFLEKIYQHKGRTLIVTFKDCTIQSTATGDILYRPEWGPFDLVCGKSVVSVFGGAADRAEFALETHQRFTPARPQKSNLTSDNRALEPLYVRVREIRELNAWNQDVAKELELIFQKLQCSSPKDWLLRWELLELFSKNQPESQICVVIKKELLGLSQAAPQIKTVILRGLDLVS